MICEASLSHKSDKFFGLAMTDDIELVSTRGPRGYQLVGGGRAIPQRRWEKHLKVITQRILLLRPIAMKESPRRAQGQESQIVDDNSTKGTKGIEEHSHKIDLVVHLVNSFAPVIKELKTAYDASLREDLRRETSKTKRAKRRAQ